MRFLLCLLILTSSLAFAEKMDEETHTIVINKLEGVLRDTKKSPKQNASLILRLADLYSERARLKFLKEGDQNCQNCLASKEDRIAAIQHYKSIIPHVEGDLGASIVMQTAHLNLMLGNEKQAKRLYKSIIIQNKSRSSQVLGQAYSGLAGIEFQQGKFKQALKNYNAALKQNNAPKRGFLVYRKAWCLLNTGKTKQAVSTMKALLSSPKLLNVSQSDDLIANASFHQDVSRDFASFLARTSIRKSDIKTLKALSPAKVQRENLFYLGTEAERVGQMNAALFVWAEYLQLSDVPFHQKLEIQARKAKIQLDIGRSKLALNEYRSAMDMWASGQCRDNVDCPGISARLRNFPVSWNKLEKKKPSMKIHSAYRTYVNVFPQDFEMHFWAAQVARKNNKHAIAMEDYRNASVSAKSPSKSSVNPKQKEALKIFEGALLAEVDMAEANGNPHLRRKAYTYYLEQNPMGQKASLIKYQLAMLDYEQKHYQKAAFQFKALAQSKTIKKDLRLKSADLALDSLNILKDHQRIRVWADELSQANPSRQKEFRLLKSRATLNLVALTLNDTKATSTEVKKVTAMLKGVSYAGLAPAEKKSYWKNRLLAAEKTKDLPEIQVASRNFLKQKKLSRWEQNWAKSLQVFAYEMRFEFRSAYKIAKETDFPNLGPVNTALKMAVLAELAGKNKDAKSYYKKFIKKTSSIRKANVVRAKLISQSRAPWKLIAEYRNKLKRTPDIYAATALETFGRFPNYKKLETILKTKSIYSHPEGKTLSRFMFLKKYWAFDKDIRSHKISQRSNARLKKSLEKRLSLLSESERWVNRAARAGDWTLQLITLDRLKAENLQLHKTITGFRTPKGLARAQRKEFREQLALQAQPYLNRYKDLDQKVNEFWKNQKALESLRNDYIEASVPVRGLVKDELNALKIRAPRNAKSKIQKILAINLKTPPRNEFNKAYNQAKKDPFAPRPLAKLIELETKKKKDSTMTGYLEERERLIKGGR